MAPTLRPRQSLSAERFPVYFSKMQPQNYPDLSRDSRAPSSSNQQDTPSLYADSASLVATTAVDWHVGNPDKPQGKFSTELKGHSAAIEKVAFNPVKDAELCSVSSDGVVKFWDVRTKNCFNEVKGLGDAFTLAWAPDGQTLIVGNKADNIFVLSPTSATVISSHQQATHTNQISFCWSGDKVFVTTAEGKIRILSYPNFEPILREQYDDEREAMLSGHTSSCLSAELQPIGRYLATGGSDSIIALWDTKDWLCKRTITSWTFDGSFIVGGSDEGNGLVVTHAETGDKVHTFNTVGPCPLVAWAPTRYWLAYNDMGYLKIVGVDVDKLDRR
ncbi:THO complex subunit-like protein [Emericellopsis cladophorae]|uniref:THO complex subunit-like protein n=1 Tax=Emericellopsis cladophorae TaxID=2686198 RepID=A0A9Q0BIF5_9HYPO|nr:THO complex subunit-like protein [Emericellopsis cladophorae]KAI6785855.1 THO complex subunit-like protein [Emericellopsis cladophorae]